MPNWEQIAMAAVRAVRPDIAEKAEKELNNYSRDKAGLQKLIKDKGGSAFLDQAASFANRAPKVKAMFDKFGVNPEVLKDNVMRELQNTEPVQAQHSASAISPGMSSMERLKKLR